ncbi:MAG: hypothetical protein AB4080_13400 [Trichodesmium sp.]
MKNKHFQKKTPNLLLKKSNKSLVGVVTRTLITTFFLPFQIAVGINFAESAMAESLINKNSQLPSNNSQIYLAQANPLYGCVRLTHSSFGIVYESALKMNGYEGIMITKYFNPNIGGTEYVQQTMRMRSSARGIVILGYNPVYAGTSRKHPTYSPDNFLFQIRPDGSYLFGTCDDAGRCSAVEVNQCPRQ